MNSKWKTAVCAFVCFVIGSAFGLQQAYAEWPKRPISVIVPFNPGGGTDIITRILADELSRQMNHPVVVENRAGAAGTIAADYVAKAPPDGHVFLMGTSGVNVLSQFFMKNVPYDTTEAFRGVAMVAGIPNVLAINPSVPAKTVAEFIAYAKANPEKLNYGASGSGSRMAMELFLHRSGIKMTMIPYRGSAPVIQDLVKGDIHATMDLLVSLQGMIDSGQLLGLALTAKSPLESNIPLLDQVGIKDAEMMSWQGVFAPKQTPAEIINKFSEQINKALSLEEVKDKIRLRGANILGGTPEQMDAFIKSEIVKFEAVAKAANIQPE